MNGFGLGGGMFDMNGDGKMSANERAYEHYVYDSINKNSDSNSSDNGSSGKSKAEYHLAHCCLFSG